MKASSAPSSSAGFRIIWHCLRNTHTHTYIYVYIKRDIGTIYLFHLMTLLILGYLMFFKFICTVRNKSKHLKKSWLISTKFENWMCLNHRKYRQITDMKTRNNYVEKVPIHVFLVSIGRQQYVSQIIDAPYGKNDSLLFFLLRWHEAKHNELSTPLSDSIE